MARQVQEQSIRILRRHEVERLVGLSRSAIYRRIADGTFCKPVVLGGGGDAHAVGFVESEVIAWIDACIAQRDKAAAK